MIREAQESLIAAVQSDRTDIVRSILSTCERCEIEEAGNLTLRKLLNDLCTKEGTLLHYATKYGYADVVRTLLAAGADPGIHNIEESTAFDVASGEKVVQVFNQELLQATAQSNVGRVCQLLASGINVNLRDSEHSGNTPMHWAASFGNRDIVQCLCDRGADMNATNSEGTTPLHDAVMRGDVGIVEELMLHGTDPNICASKGKCEGKSPLDVAALKPELLAVLRSSDLPLSNVRKEFERASISEGTTPTKHLKKRFSMDSVLTDVSEARLNMNGTPPSQSSLPNGHTTPAVHNGLLDSSDNEAAIHSTEALLPPDPLITDQRLNMLWPQPQTIIQLGGKALVVAQQLDIYVTCCDKGSAFTQQEAWKLLEPEFKALNYKVHLAGVRPLGPTANATQVLCHVNHRLLPKKDAYKLVVSSNRIKIMASDSAGLFYGVCTLLQLFKLCVKDGIPQLQITDWSHVAYRGVMLDFSQGRVPKLAVLMNTIDLLARLKINQVHMYYRFRLKDQQEWQFCYSQSELLDMEKFASERHIGLVPVIDIVPHVCFTNLPEMYSTFHDFISAFPHASSVHIGPRLSMVLVDPEDLDSLDVRRQLPICMHHTVALCSNSLHDYRHALPQLPMDLVLVEYGFEATYDFHAVCKPFRDFGLSFGVCAGTAAWNSLAGCPEASVSNLYHAAQCAQSQGALAMLVADWAGTGHLTHKTLSWTGFLALAGLGWNYTTHWDFLHTSLATLINHHIVMDQEMMFGQAIIELGRAETYMVRASRDQDAHDASNLPATNGSILYQLLANPDGVLLENMSGDIFHKAIRHIRRCQIALPKARLECCHSSQMMAELQLMTEMMMLACKIGRVLVNMGRNPSDKMPGFKVINVGVANIPATTKTDLANKLLSVIEQYRDVWLENNLPVGLHTSLLILTTILKQFIPDSGTTVSSQFEAGKKLL
ncbi:PREDICTED: uncharacterized protein LOC106806376 [Priapulus caudatus]|uniref:Uncharacterized protein LOC106806376 n=1 Tax=Priapulus caudatus TaxID=37621 RepID=A0ABM1DV13_PRICU|nr:PREDICTED: uncharacterized protein LOC106806376 [Priapulus caudatus]